MKSMHGVQKISEDNRQEFDQIASHPLQSWSWGKFRELLGQKVLRLGRFEGKKLVEATQFSIHRIPHMSWSVGYLPRSGIPSREMIDAIREETRKHKCIFVKLEPNEVIAESGKRKAESQTRLNALPFTLHALGLRPGKPLFTPFTFQIDLRKSESDLLAAMKPKTRYNIRVAEKHGVVVGEDNSDEAFEAFQRLTDETTKRQHFFAHDRRYRQLMWETMRDSAIAHLLIARYRPPSSRGQPRDLAKRFGKTEVLSTWILFFFNGVAYYPYGASSDQHREFMASNLMAWRALQLAKAAGCHTFDFWGALGPSPTHSGLSPSGSKTGEPDTNDPWYGFHRFKEGYGGKLVEFVGTWDLVINPLLYRMYQLGDQLRWWVMRRLR